MLCIMLINVQMTFSGIFSEIKLQVNLVTLEWQNEHDTEMQTTFNKSNGALKYELMAHGFLQST